MLVVGVRVGVRVNAGAGVSVGVGAGDGEVAVGALGARVRAGVVALIAGADTIEDPAGGSLDASVLAAAGTLDAVAGTGGAGAELVAVLIGAVAGGGFLLPITASTITITLPVIASADKPTSSHPDAGFGPSTVRALARPAVPAAASAPVAASAPAPVAAPAAAPAACGTAASFCRNRASAASTAAFSPGRTSVGGELSRA